MFLHVYLFYESRKKTAIRRCKSRLVVMQIPLLPDETQGSFETDPA
jgi:hypothetical protein